MSLKDMVSPSLRTIAKNTQRFGSETKRTEKATSRLWSVIKTGASQSVVSLGNLTRATMRFSAVATAAGATALFAVGKSTVDSAAQLESYRLTLETVMKDSKKAGETLKWASNFAALTPFETDSVVEATVRLQSYGIVAQDTLGSIGDMASVMGKDLMQAVEAVADAQTGELERLKEFGITKKMLEKKSGEMFKNQVVVNNKGQIVQMEKFNAALFALMNERFAGGMEKQSRTYKGLMSRIKGTIKMGMTEIAGITADGTIRTGSLFDKLKGHVESIADKFAEWEKDGTIQRIASKVDSMVGNFESKLPEIKQFFIDLKEPLQTTGDVLSTIGKGLGNIVKFANENPEIAKAIGLTAGGAFLAKNLGLFDLLKAAGSATGNKVGVQNVQAGVVNVYGGKVNGGGVAGAPVTGGKSGKSTTKSTSPASTSTTPSRVQTYAKKPSMFSNLKTSKSGGLLGIVGGTVALNLIPENAPTWIKDIKNAITGEPSEKLQKHLAAKQEEQNTQLEKIAANTSKPLPNNINLNISYGGVTVREEADIDKITSKLHREIITNLQNMTNRFATN
ncbi:hypothetical protein M6D81_11855 [Paenibacillus sp. J5C_2022]|nr:hypothetical protein [Paenibacillus sp. J5C2022]